MINNFDKIQLLSPEKTPLTSPQKNPTISSRFKTPTKFYEIDKEIESPIKSTKRLKTSHILYQTQIDSYTHKKNPIIISDSESENENDSVEIDNIIDKTNVKSDIWYE